MLRLSLQLVVASLACVTLTEAIMRAMEVENTYERYHMAKGSDQSITSRGRQRVRFRLLIVDQAFQPLPH